MSKRRSFFSIPLIIFFSGSAFAQQSTVVEIQGEIANFIARHFVGVEKSVSTKWDGRDRFGFGPVTRADGWAKIDAMPSWNGFAQHVRVPEVYVNLIRTDMQFGFLYSGQTSANKYVYPSGSFVDRPWENLHPKGNIDARIYSNQGTGYSVEVKYKADPDHPGRPSEVVGMAAQAIAEEFRAVVERYIQSKGIPAKVILK